MPIILSAHTDTVFRPTTLAFSKGQHQGLLDNFAGVLVTYLALYNDPVLAALEASEQLSIFHWNQEEWMRDLPKEWVARGRKPKTIVVVVDVAAGSQYKGIDFSLENISGVPAKHVSELRDALKWEGYNVRVKSYDGNPDDEDEAWAWRAVGCPALSFIIPIQGKDDSWHRRQQDNTVQSSVVATAAQGLVRTINYLGSWYLD